MLSAVALFNSVIVCLKVNLSPSFTTDSKLDREIKDLLVYDSLNLVNFDAVDKKKCIEEERRKAKDRLFQKQQKKETKLVIYVIFLLYQLVYV